VKRVFIGIPLAASLLTIPAHAALGQAIPPEVRRVAVELRERAFAGTRAAEWARGLTDEVGPRLSGSPQDPVAVAWALKTLKALGFTNVHAEKVMVPAWRRGVETGEVTAPYRQPLVLTALGGSVPTPEGGIEAEVLEVPSLEALDAKSADAVKGKIVFFNKKMERGSEMRGYGYAVDVRTSGASHAARLGAAAVLIRSIGTDHNRLPHTGALIYTVDIPRIPAAALAIPDAELLERLLAQGKPVRVKFTLTCGDRPEAESANVIGEIRGSSKPDEIVLLGAHRDSWDLGTGAIDDAAGCGIVIEAARLIGLLPKHPPRTIRVCLYANEENGSAGGKAYFNAHEAELSKHAAALESDSGTDLPTGFTWTAAPSAEPFVKELAEILEPLGAGVLSPGGGGADVGFLKIAGVPMFAVRQDTSRYFDYHHTANDTFDKIDPEGLDRNVAAVAAFAYCAASTPQILERIPPDKRGEPRRRPQLPPAKTR
jgi:Zn-dependent M28 family amino/carboxypeptidase